MAKNSAKEQGATSAASVFKAIDNVLKKPGCGCSGSLDYEKMLKGDSEGGV